MFIKEIDISFYQKLNLLRYFLWWWHPSWGLHERWYLLSFCIFEVCSQFNSSMIILCVQFKLSFLFFANIQGRNKCQSPIQRNPL